MPANNQANNQGRILRISTTHAVNHYGSAKRSIGAIEEGKRLEGGNVISMVGRHQKE